MLRLAPAKLSSFTGLDPNGLWVLFLSDRSAGNQAILNSWTLAINPLPEPESYGMVVAGALLAVCIWRNARSRGRQW